MIAPTALDAVADGVDNGTFTVFDLEQERFVGAPSHDVQHPAFFYGMHRRHQLDGARRTSASGVVVTVEHFATHVDAFCHQAFEGKLFGGVPISSAIQTDGGFTQLGAETIAPFVARGLLVDVAARGDLAPNSRIEADDLVTTLEHQGTHIEKNDVVLVRTGGGRFWHSSRHDYEQAAGIAPSASRYLADAGVRAVGADNMAWDVVGYDDPELGSFAGHVVLLVQAGIYIFENLNLESLSAARAFEFLFIAASLKLRGATGAPARPIAIAATTAKAAS